MQPCHLQNLTNERQRCGRAVGADGTNDDADRLGFTPQWRARAKATYGTEPELIYFDSPLQIDMTGTGEK